MPSMDACTAHAVETVAKVPSSMSNLFDDGDPILNRLETLTLEEICRDNSPPPICYKLDEAKPETTEKCDTRSQTRRSKVTTIRPKGIPISKSGESYKRTLPVRCDVRINDTDGKPVKSLLDTGASLSIISKEIFERLFDKNILELNNSIKVKGVGMDQSLGTFITTVFINSTSSALIELDVEFHVMTGFDAGCCIGNEVMDSYGINTLMTEKKAHIPSVDAKFDIKYVRSKQNYWSVLSSKNTIIPAHHFQVIPVDFDAQFKDVDHFFDPGIDIHTATDTFGLCSKAIISGSARQLVYTNFGDRPIEIEKGTILGHAKPLTSVDKCNDTGEFFNLETVEGHCNTGNTPTTDLNLPEVDVKRQIAVIPDGEDRFPEPHSGKPTYKMFDVAINKEGVPHPEICRVLDDNMKAFSLDGAPGQVCDGMKMRINTKDRVLIPESARRVGPEKTKVIKDTVKQLLDWKVISPSNSPVSYPLVVVMQNGKWRMCVDYRRLNEATEADRYPMQRIDSVFDSLHGMLFFSVMDAIRGYHNIPIDELDKWKTAFICAEGLFHWNFMPFGLKTAPAVFQRLIDKIMGYLRGRSAMAYIDDIILFTKTLLQHCQDLDTLLKAITKSGLRLSPDKCHFGYQNLGLLGRIVGREGLRIDRHRAQAVIDLPIPTTMEQLYHVNGLFGHYRMFIFNYAKIAAPLTAATAGNEFRNPAGKLSGEWKTKRVNWTKECQQSFDKLKEIISNPPVLAFPDLSLRCYVYVDASKNAFAFAIHQRFPKEKPVYTSFATEPEKIISEWVDAIKRDNLFGKIYDNLDSNPDFQINGQGLLLVNSSEGKRICVPRTRVHNICRDCHDAVGHPGFARSWHLMKQSWYRPKLYGALQSYIANCPECLRNKVSRRPKEGEMPEKTQIEPIAFNTIAMDFVTALPSDKGMDTILTVVDLWTKAVILIPCTEKYTAASVASLFVQHVLRQGFLPKQFVTDRDKVFLSHFWQALTEQMQITTSFTSPYHAQSDPAERYNQTVETALRAFTADRPSWVDSLLWVEVAMNSLKSDATGFTPWQLLYNNATGPFTEIHNSIVKQSNQVDDVDDLLIMARERIAEAKDAVAKAHRAAKHYYDKRHSPLRQYAVGDWAFIRLDLRPLRIIDSTKLTSPKLGPFKVIESHKRSVKLDLPANMKIHPTFSVQHLEHSPSPDSDPFGRELRPPPTEVIEGTDAFEVERLLAKRLFGRNKFIQYKVKWVGYPDSESTWVFRDDLIEDGLQSLVDEFENDLDPTVKQRKMRGRDGAIPSRRSNRTNNSASIMPNHEKDSSAYPMDKKFDLQQPQYDEKPIWFEPRVTRPYERNYQSLELELACITWTVLKAQKYLDGNSFTVFTDHSNMRSVLNSKTETLYSRQVDRFRILLQPWLSQIEFVHKPGRYHRNVDALSRLTNLPQP